MTTIQEKLTDISNIMLKEEINEQDKIEAQNKLKDIHSKLEKTKFFNIEYFKIKIKFGNDDVYLKNKKKIKICKLVEKDTQYYIDKYNASRETLNYVLLKKNKIHKTILEINDLTDPIFFQNDYGCSSKVNLLITKIELM
tara:strand:- start:3762 stop:4181 length:420 start_codon:yes stop_codon:yes gene_type:complete